MKLCLTFVFLISHCQPFILQDDETEDGSCFLYDALLVKQEIQKLASAVSF